MIEATYDRVSMNDPVRDPATAKFRLHANPELP